MSMGQMQLTEICIIPWGLPAASAAPARRHGEFCSVLSPPQCFALLPYSSCWWRPSAGRHTEQHDGLDGQGRTTGGRAAVVPPGGSGLTLRKNHHWPPLSSTPDPSIRNSKQFEEELVRRENKDRRHPCCSCSLLTTEGRQAGLGDPHRVRDLFCGILRLCCTPVA
jgi:hypothetical protein